MPWMTQLFQIVCLSILAALLSAEPLHWRLVGPFRGGRVTSVAGVPSQPNVYYFGTPGGGIWKTTSGGQVWKPIFDSTGVATIDRKSTRLNSSHLVISYAVFCLTK